MADEELPAYERLTSKDLQAYVGATGNTPPTFVVTCWREAQSLVDTFVGPALLLDPTRLPVVDLDRAYLEVGSELYHRQKAPNGIAQFATPDGAAVRVARDPMVGAYPILRQYVGLGIG